jgi:hypothetical protein
VGRLQDHALLRDVAASRMGDPPGFHPRIVEHGFADPPATVRRSPDRRDRPELCKILAETESGAIPALGAGLESSRRRLVVASALLGLPQGKVSTERDNHAPTGPNRAFPETAAPNLIARGVRSSIVRLSPSVHGAAGDHGFMAHFIGAARKKGVSPYIGDGTDRWPPVHVSDAARRFCLALGKGEAGAKFHGVEEVGIPFREIASLNSARLNVPTAGIPAAKAGKHFGIIGSFVGLDIPASSEWTWNALGWRPENPGMFADMDAHYFGSDGLAAAA